MKNHFKRNYILYIWAAIILFLAITCPDFEINFKGGFAWALVFCMTTAYGLSVVERFRSKN